MPQPLGRVLDPVALDASRGTVARMRVCVPRGWLARGVEIEVDLPGSLACARCDAGGCDSCGRSGAHRLGEEDRRAIVRVHLPASAAAAGFVVRLVRPLGNDTLQQLHLEVQPSEEASAGVRCLAPPAPSGAPAAPHPGPRSYLWLALVVAIAVASAIALGR